MATRTAEAAGSQGRIARSASQPTLRPPTIDPTAVGRNMAAASEFE